VDAEGFGLQQPRSFGREKNLRALYDNETPTSGRATSSA